MSVTSKDFELLRASTWFKRYVGIVKLTWVTPPEYLPRRRIIYLLLSDRMLKPTIRSHEISSSSTTPDNTIIPIRTNAYYSNFPILCASPFFIILDYFIVLCIHTCLLTHGSLHPQDHTFFSSSSTSGLQPAQTSHRTGHTLLFLNPPPFHATSFFLRIHFLTACRHPHIHDLAFCILFPCHVFF